MKKLIRRILKEELGDKTIDYILDKIGQYGIKSLTKKEKELIDNYSKGNDINDIEKLIHNRMNWKEGMFKYDPRKDEEMMFDFSDYSDEDIRKNRLEIIWNEISDDQIEDFFDYYDLNISDYKNKNGDLPGDLPSSLESKFEFYVENIL